jgi:hypothetical protein
MQVWAEGNVSATETAEYLKNPLHFQVSSSDEVLALLDGTNSLHSGDQPEWRNLRHLLNLYGREVLEVLETALRGRRELIDELGAELPQLRAGAPELLQVTVGRLESARDELGLALMQLQEYIREHFPPDNALMQ